MMTMMLIMAMVIMTETMMAMVIMAVEADNKGINIKWSFEVVLEIVALWFLDVSWGTFAWKKAVLMGL